MGFLGAGIGVFEVAAMGFWGAGNGVFAVAALGRVDPLRTLAMGDVGGQPPAFLGSLNLDRWQSASLTI
jgi:hypothetical protein